MINLTNASGVNITDLRARYAEMKALTAVRGLSSQERSQAQEIVKNTNLSADEAAFRVKEGSFGSILKGVMESMG